MGRGSNTGVPFRTRVVTVLLSLCSASLAPAGGPRRVRCTLPNPTPLWFFKGIRSDPKCAKGHFVVGTGSAMAWGQAKVKALENARVLMAKANREAYPLFPRDFCTEEWTDGSYRVSALCEYVAPQPGKAYRDGVRQLAAHLIEIMDAGKGRNLPILLGQVDYADSGVPSPLGMKIIHDVGVLLQKSFDVRTPAALPRTRSVADRSAEAMATSTRSLPTEKLAGVRAVLRGAVWPRKGEGSVSVGLTLIELGTARILSSGQAMMDIRDQAVPLVPAEVGRAKRNMQACRSKRWQ